MVEAPGMLAASKLETLPQRPPTPPRESHNLDARPSLTSRLLTRGFGGQTTPNQSPNSSAESTSRTIEKSQKKVEWSPFPEYNYPSKPSGRDVTPINHAVHPLGERKPTKSILKPYNGIIPVNRSIGNDKLPAPHTYPSFATMLESIVRELAGEDRGSRIDAYMQLCNVLKASDNLPDPKALREKMGLLTQFIQRDMAARTSSGTLDTAVVNNAVILLNSFLWKASIADMMTADFCTYVIEYAINAFEDKSVPKDVVKYMLFAVGAQSFSAKIMNPERVGRLIQSLRTIEDHVKGRSIILGRLTIFRKLLKQAKVSMITNLGWLENLFTDMFTSLKDIKVAAIAFGFEAALLLGSEKQVSRAVMDLFKMEYNDARYADYYVNKLSSMVRNKQDGSSVPQIWSIVVLFLRNRPHQLEQWEFMKPWVQIIQECFNSSETEVKAQANLAWNRLVFSLRIDESTSPTMIKMLSQALSGQLKRKLTGKYAKESRQKTMGSVCNLLYYALRPNATFAQLDLYWDEYVIQLVCKTLVTRNQDRADAEQNDLTHACAIIGALFDTSSKPWINNRANEPRLVQASELPGMDPKWIRKNPQRVFTILRPLIEKCFWELGKNDSPITSVWKAFVSSVASAGIKEIKVSNDTMLSVACIFQLLYKLWQQGPKDIPASVTGNSEAFTASFSCLVTTTIDSLGVLPFTEKLLSIGPQDTFAVVATPSHHPLILRGEVMSPLHHLLGLLLRPPTGLVFDDSYIIMIETILQPFFEVRRSQKSSIELLKDLSQLIVPSTSDPEASIIMWRALAALSSGGIAKKGESSSSGSHDQPLGVEYRDVVRFLEMGINVSPNAPSQEWKDLFSSISSQVTVEAGDSGRAISIIEPLARALSTRHVSGKQVPGLAYCPMIISGAAYPVERQALDAARRRLWGSAGSTSKSPSSDPFSHLYTSVGQSLVESYKSLSDTRSEVHIEILAAVADLLNRCPAMAVTSFLTNVQEGLGSWAEDDELKFGGRASSTVASVAATLWTNVCNAVKKIPQTDSHLLAKLEPLICSGLKSKHQSVVSTTVTMWNSTFGCESNLDYPPKAAKALFRLRSIADLQLPCFPRDLQDEDISDRPTFLESQEDSLPYLSSSIEVPRASTTHDQTVRFGSSLLLSGVRRSYPQVIVEVQDRVTGRSRHGTPEPNRRKIIKRDLTPKLRHDDSQIHFAPIESSPLEAVVLDPQILTDRQREVKERQQIEAANMFPDLRSSPKVKTRTAISNLTLSSDLAAPDLDNIEKPTTPTLAGRDNSIFDDYVTSSPTPRRGQADITMDSDAVDPPSSPPERPVQEDHNSLLSSVLVDADVPDSNMWDATSPAPHESTGPEVASTDLGPSAQIITSLISTSEQVESLPSDELKPTRSTAVERDVDKLSSVETGRVLSPQQSIARTLNEQFVDALSSPILKSPVSAELPSDDIFLDAVSSPDTRSVLAEIPVAQEGQQNLHSDSQARHLQMPKSPGSERRSSSDSEMDEDSMLRLITRFDDIPETRVEITHQSLEENLAKATSKSSDDLDCITVILKEGPDIYEDASVDPESKLDLSSFIKPTRTIPYNLKRTVPSTVPETPAKADFKPAASVDSAQSVRLTRAGKLRSSLEPTESAKKRIRNSARLQEKDDSETNKRRKMNSRGDLTVPDSQEAEAAVAATPTNKGKKGRKTRSSQRRDGRARRSGRNFPTSSVDLDAKLHDIDDFTSEGESQVSVSYTNGEETGPILLSTTTGDNDTSAVSMSGVSREGDTVSVGSANYDMEQDAEPMEVPSPQVAHLSQRLTDAFVFDEGGDNMEKPKGKVTGSSVIDRFEDVLEAMRSVALTREEARKLDDLLWDLKGELSAAEIRGRRDG